MKTCKKCSSVLTIMEIKQDHPYFYCLACHQYTFWDEGMVIENLKISPLQLDYLITMFIDQKTSKQAWDILSYNFVNQPLNIKTVRKYFSLFSRISLHYYIQQLSLILLDSEVEIDETFFFRGKKSFAPHRHYEYGNIWVFGIKKRQSSQIIIIPVASRDEATLTSIILKFIKIGSHIYSDSFSVYVNNHTFPKKSKLEKWGHIHQYVNHRIEFVYEIFEEIHTNGIESLWKDMKWEFKKSKTVVNYLPLIGRFYFQKLSTKEQQNQVLYQAIQSSRIPEVDELEEKIKSLKFL